MVNHIVMFRWTHSLTDVEFGQIQQAFDGLRAIDEVLNLQHGADLGIRGDNADYVAVVTFADWNSFLRYLTHPNHLHLVDVISGVTNARWSAQIE